MQGIGKGSCLSIKMDEKSFEMSIINNAASTLAGIKPASLFNFSFTSYQQCYMKLAEMNALLNAKGVFIELLKCKNDFYLIYVYRQTALRKILVDEGTRDLLADYGYDRSLGLTECLEHLKERLDMSEAFPHEIGAFLGYPLGDIRGFIENEGRNYSCCGIWKVYSNEKESVRFFDKVKKCQTIYARVFNQGRSIYDMTVGA